MVQLIDFDRLDVVKVNESELLNIKIDIIEEDLLNRPSKELYGLINKHVRNTIAHAAIPLNSNLWVEITIKDSTIETNEKSLYLLCANIIAANLLVGKTRERESRLKVPSIIQTDGLFGLIWLKRMVNEQMVCDVIGGVVKINDKEVKLI